MEKTIRSSTFEEELKAGHSITYFTVGKSMEPLLYERKTQVVITPVEQIRPGDILLYRRSGGQYILHRLIEQKEDFYYIRGDNTYSLEEVWPKQVLGVVTHIYRNGRLFDVRTDKRYRFYVWFWCHSYPMRLFYSRVRGKMQRIWNRRIKKKED